MAKEVKFGSWLFRFSDNYKELQRASQGCSSIMRTYINKPFLTLLCIAVSNRNVCLIHRTKVLNLNLMIK